MAEQRNTPILEWIAAAAGLAMLGGVTFVIGREIVTGQEGALPALVVHAKRVVPNAAGYVVEFEVENRSGGTAAAVEIEGRLGEGAAAETSTATLDYVAGDARVTGGLFFAQDPARAPLKLRALGYQTP